jgi:hypothetical protein
MAHSVPTLTPGSITAMTGLTKRPVYFLTMVGFATPNLVVKGEAGHGNHPEIADDDATVSVKWGSKLMKNVNHNQVNTKIMTGPEIAVFQAFAAASTTLGATPKLNATNVGGMYTWVKMPYVAGLTDAEYYDDATRTPLAPKIKENILKFSDDEVWRDLGRVVAVDIFNGNSDRFVVVPDGATPLGHWQNKGNVMFMPAGSATAVIGLDTFDPNAGVNADLVRGGRFDALKILTEPARRDPFALACTQSVGNEMKRGFKASAGGAAVATFTLRTVGPGGRPELLRVDVEQMGSLFTGYAPIFAQGITDGAQRLKTYLQGKVGSARYQPRAAPAPWAAARPGGAGPAVRGPLVMGAARATAPLKTIPQGILDRMAFLGW